jgi:hypothetical protein
MGNFLEPELQLPACKIDAFNANDQFIPKPELILILITLQRMGIAIIAIPIRGESLKGHHTVNRYLDPSNHKPVRIDTPDYPCKHLADFAFEKM